MKITDHFERIYIVNLPDRTDRRAEMERELHAQGISSQDKCLRFFPAIRPADAGLFPSVGARGCFMSHLGLLSEALQDGITNVLVMEDDLAIAPHFHRCEGAMLDGLDKVKWDIAYFGHVEAAGGNPDAPLWISYSRPMQCLHFYALNTSAITSLHDYLRACLGRKPGHPEGGPMHVDGAYSMFRMSDTNTVTLMASPSLGGQRSSRSDIASNKWYDRTPVLRELTSIARRGKNWRALRPIS